MIILLYNIIIDQINNILTSKTTCIFSTFICNNNHSFRGFFQQTLLYAY